MNYSLSGLGTERADKCKKNIRRNENNRNGISAEFDGDLEHSFI